MVKMTFLMAAVLALLGFLCLTGPGGSIGRGAVTDPSSEQVRQVAARRKACKEGGYAIATHCFWRTTSTAVT